VTYRYNPTPIARFIKTRSYKTVARFQLAMARFDRSYSLFSAINVSSPALGKPCWRHDLSLPKKQRWDRKEPANNEKFAADEVFAISKVGLSLTKTVTVLEIRRHGFLVGFS
jgi:hypothetical protein